MTREEQLKKAFIAHLESKPGWKHFDAEFRDSPTFFLWRELFLAGANAQANLAPDFGDPPTFMGKPVVIVEAFLDDVMTWPTDPQCPLLELPPSEIPTPRQSSQDGPPAADLPTRHDHDIGGEAGGA